MKNIDPVVIFHDKQNEVDYRINHRDWQTDEEATHFVR